MKALNVARFRGRPGFQAIVLAGATGVSQILMAAIFAIVARHSAPAAFGLATVGYSMATIAVSVLDFGTSTYWLREMAREPSLLTQMFNRMGSKLVLNAAASLILVTVCLTIPALNFWWPLAVVLFGMQAELTLAIPLRAAARVSVVSASMLLNRVVTLAAVLALGMLGMGVMRLLVATGLGSMAAAAFMWWKGGSELTRGRGTFTWANPWSGSSRFGIISLSASLQALDAPLLTRLAGAAQTGLYGAVNRWTQPIALLISAFCQASIPHVAAARTIRKGWGAIRRSSILLVGALVVAVLVVLFAKPVILLLLGPAYEGSAQVLRVLAVSTAIVIFNQPVAMILQTTGHDGLVSICLPSGVVVQLLGIVVLAPRFGATGAALAACIAQVAMAMMLGTALAFAIRQEGRLQRTTEHLDGIGVQ